MATESDRVLVLIPAYQAADSVGAVAEVAGRYLPVLVVDDGSTDATGEAARAVGAEVIRQAPNQGKGAALRTGFRRALDEDYHAVLTLDADGQHDPVSIPHFLAEWHRARPELIIGARDYSQMPFVRRMSNTIGRWSLSKALGREIPDNQSGYRLLSRRLVTEMLDSAESGFEFEVEMVLVCVRRDWPIEWVPIRTIYNDERSHISPVQHVVHFFRMVWKARQASGRRG